jgi:protein-tyrosine phosphatase
VLASVEASFLAAAFDIVHAEYGNLESYFQDGLGLGPRKRAALDERYLAR